MMPPPPPPPFPHMHNGSRLSSKLSQRLDLRLNCAHIALPPHIAPVVGFFPLTLVWYALRRKRRLSYAHTRHSSSFQVSSTNLLYVEKGTIYPTDNNKCLKRTCDAPRKKSLNSLDFLAKTGEGTPHFSLFLMQYVRTLEHSSSFPRIPQRRKRPELSPPKKTHPSLLSHRRFEGKYFWAGSPLFPPLFFGGKKSP